jgi:steroid 5-alpha reductase family enzyme
MLMKIVVKLFGKKIIDGALEKWGISKTKVVAVVGVLIYAVESLAPAFGWEFKIDPELKSALIAAGLWTLRDGMDPQKPA